MEFGFSLVNFCWGSVEYADARDCHLVLLNCLSVFFIFSLSLVCWMVDILMGGMECDMIVRVVENCFSGSGL